MGTKAVVRTSQGVGLGPSLPELKQPANLTARFEQLLLLQTNHEITYNTITKTESDRAPVKVKTAGLVIITGASGITAGGGD